MYVCMAMITCCSFFHKSQIVCIVLFLLHSNTSDKNRGSEGYYDAAKTYPSFIRCKGLDTRSTNTYPFLLSSCRKERLNRTSTKEE